MSLLNIDASGIIKDIAGIADQFITTDGERENFKIQAVSAINSHIAKIQELDNADRDSARKRQMEVKDSMPSILSCVIVIGFFGILVYILNYDIAEKSRDIANIMLGALGAGFTGVLNYYFGSSSSSKSKNETINRMSEK
jgi:UDP-N-acetylmuramyl pentapeptide phosphotransferase/UDP-N-acetylglucosamine-1-phosphate transferase